MADEPTEEKYDRAVKVKLVMDCTGEIGCLGLFAIAILCIILFVGEPDIQDAIIYWLTYGAKDVPTR